MALILSMFNRWVLLFGPVNYCIHIKSVLYLQQIVVVIGMNCEYAAQQVKGISCK